MALGLELRGWGRPTNMRKKIVDPSSGSSATRITADTGSAFVKEANENVQGWPTLKREGSNEPGAELRSQQDVVRKAVIESLSDNGRGIETDDESKRSCSAIANKRLRESTKSGGFVFGEKERGKGLKRNASK
jgi:hypothetical protein